MRHLTTTIMPVLGCPTPLLLPRLLPSAAIVVVGVVGDVVVSVAVGIPNVFLTRTRSLGESEGDGASLARNTDYGDGAMMTTASEGKKGGEGRNNAKFELGSWKEEGGELQLELSPN